MNQHWHRRQCSEDETDAAQTSITLDHGLVLEYAETERAQWEERVQALVKLWSESSRLKCKLDTSINDSARAPTARVGDGTSITGGTRASSR